MDQMGKRLFLFHSNLDVQGPLCVTENDMFIYLCLWVRVNICCPSPVAPSVPFCLECLEERSLQGLLLPCHPYRSEHSAPVDWLANHQPAVVGDYLCCLARPSPGMVITLASVAASGVSDPIEKHCMDTNSEDCSLAQGKQCTFRSYNQSLPFQ